MDTGRGHRAYLLMRVQRKDLYGVVGQINYDLYDEAEPTLLHLLAEEVAWSATLFASQPRKETR